MNKYIKLGVVSLLLEVVVSAGYMPINNGFQDPNQTTVCVAHQSLDNNIQRLLKAHANIAIQNQGLQQEINELNRQKGLLQQQLKVHQIEISVLLQRNKKYQSQTGQINALQMQIRMLQQDNIRLNVACLQEKKKTEIERSKRRQEGGDLLQEIESLKTELKRIEEILELERSFRPVW